MGRSPRRTSAHPFCPWRSEDAPPAGAPPATGRGGGFSQPTPSDWNDHDGWKQIFDGQTLDNWNCDPAIWSVADGAITAKSTADKPAGATYCCWMGGEPAKFELKLEFRMLVGGNGGIQYRSVPQPLAAASPATPEALAVQPARPAPSRQRLRPRLCP